MLNLKKLSFLSIMLLSCVFIFNPVQANDKDGDKDKKEKTTTTTSTESTTTFVEPHCEVPCGIYDDSLRVKLMYEHITTVEKAMNEIEKLSKEGTTNYNQLVRWVMNKEQHAEEIQEIVSQYFLHQRIKMKATGDKHDYDHYIRQLTSLHEVLVYAMKAKQTTDLAYIKKLRDSVKLFENNYFLHTH